MSASVHMYNVLAAWTLYAQRKLKFSNAVCLSMSTTFKLANQEPGCPLLGSVGS